MKYQPSPPTTTISFGTNDGIPSTGTEKPLFIPLKKEYYEAFASGKKDTEYRLYSKRWSIYNCTIGRKVILSCGYSKGNRLRARICSYKMFKYGELFHSVLYSENTVLYNQLAKIYQTINGDTLLVAVQLDRIEKIEGRNH